MWTIRRYYMLAYEVLDLREAHQLCDMLVLATICHCICLEIFLQHIYHCSQVLFYYVFKSLETNYREAKIEKEKAPHKLRLLSMDTSYHVLHLDLLVSTIWHEKLVNLLTSYEG